MPTPNDLPGAQPAAPAAAPPAAPAAPTPPAVPAVPVAAQTPPAAPAPAATPPAAPAAAEPPKPPWGSDEEFDPERAWSLIQNLRGDNQQLKDQVQPLLAQQDEARRAEQGVVATAQEDATKAAAAADAWRNRAVTAEARTLAADKFQDPADALVFVGDLAGYVQGDQIDTAGLQARLDQLAADKPYLLKQAPPQGFTPDRGQGQSGTGQPIDARIEAAQASGDIAQSIALKQQKYFQNKPK